jgi:hypothetical protein
MGMSEVGSTPPEAPITENALWIIQDSILVSSQQKAVALSAILPEEARV